MAGPESRHGHLLVAALRPAAAPQLERAGLFAGTRGKQIAAVPPWTAPARSPTSRRGWGESAAAAATDPASTVPNEAVRSYVRRLEAANHLHVGTLDEHLRDPAKPSGPLLPQRLAWISSWTHSDLQHELPELRGLGPISLAGTRYHAPFGFDPTPRRACRRCVASRGITREVICWIPPNANVCLQHQRWIGPTNRDNADQFDLVPLPEIVAAARRYRRLGRRFGDDRVEPTYQVALHIALRWAERENLGQHRERRLRILGLDPKRSCVASHHPALRAAMYPEVVSLAGLLSSHHWLQVATSPDHADHQCSSAEAARRLNLPDHQPCTGWDPLASWIDRNAPWQFREEQSQCRRRTTRSSNIRRSDQPDAGGPVLSRDVGGDDQAGALTAVGLTPDDPRSPVRAYLNRLSPGSQPAMLSSLATITALACGLRGEEFASPQAFQQAARAAAFTLPWWLLSGEHAKELHAALVARYQPATANRHLAALRGVLKECWRLGLMGYEQYARAADLASVAGSTVEMERLVTQGELRELFKLCATDPRLHGPRDAALLALLAAGGLRCNEALEVDVDNYDQSAGAVRVTHGKGHQQRLVHLDRGAQDAMRNWLELRRRLPDPDRDGRYPLLVSILKGGRRLNPRRLTVSRVNRILDERARRAHIPPFTAHDLRRTLGGDLLDDDVDLSTVQKILGHASPVTTANHYDRRGERAKQAAARGRHTPYIRWRGSQADTNLTD